MNKLILGLVAGLAGMLSCSNCVWALPIVVTNTGSWNQATSGFAWGPLNTNTYGEVFQVPVAANTFNQMTFYIKNDPATAQLFDAFVGIWSGSNRPIGAPIGQSLGLIAPGTNSGPGGFDAVSADFGSVSVTPGQELVVYYTTSAYSQSPSQSAKWGNTHAGSPTQFGVYFNNGSNLAILSDGSSSWDGPSFGDFAFTAQFNNAAAVPEIDAGSATVPLALVVITLMLVTDRRRRNSGLPA